DAGQHVQVVGHLLDIEVPDPVPGPPAGDEDDPEEGAEQEAQASHTGTALPSAPADEHVRAEPATHPDAASGRIPLPRRLLPAAARRSRGVVPVDARVRIRVETWASARGVV